MTEPITAASRAAAQARADDIAAFRRELIRLEEAQVVDLDTSTRSAIETHQARVLDALASRFDVDRGEASGRLSRGMRIVSFLGALAFAASAALLFDHLRGSLDEAVQVAILVIATLGLVAAPFAIASHESSNHFTALAAMTAFACFVCDLWMLGDLFDLTPSDNAFLAWGALALLLAYAFELRLLLAAALSCGAAFIAARTATYGGLYWLGFGERPETFLLPALAIFALPSIVRMRRWPAFPAVYRVYGLLLFFLPVLVLSNWGRASVIDGDPAVIEGCYQVLGFVGSALAATLGVRRRWNGVVNCSVALFVLFLYTKLFDWWWTVMPKWLFFLVIALTALLLLFVFRRLRATLQPVGSVA